VDGGYRHSDLCRMTRPSSTQPSPCLERRPPCWLERNQNPLGKVVIVLNGTCDDVRLLPPAEWRSCTSTPPTGLSWRLGLTALANAIRSHHRSNRVHKVPIGAVARRERCGARTAYLSARDLGGDLGTNQADRTPVLAS